MMAAQLDTTDADDANDRGTDEKQRGPGNMDESSDSSNGPDSQTTRVGNHTQENFSELLECPQCGVEARLDTPSVGLANCDNDDCDMRVFGLASTEENKYGT